MTKLFGPTKPVLLPVTTSTAKRHNLEVSRQGDDCGVRATMQQSYIYSRAAESQYGGGRWRTIQKSQRRTYVRALAILDSPRLVRCIVHRHDFILLAPRGYKWDIDTNGLRLVARDCADADYHPSADELELPGANCESLVIKLEALRAERVLVAKNERVRESERKLALRSGYICVRDSIRAGNCVSGTLSWLEQRKLDSARHYPLRAVASMCTEGRALAALNQAIARHAREMRDGVCLLAEHAA